MQLAIKKRHLQTLLNRLLIIVLSCVSSVALATDSFYSKLQVTDLEGNRIDMSQFKGGLVLVNFWATWCTPCVKEMPSLQRLQDQFTPEEFQVVAINLGQTSSTIDTFFKEQSFDFKLPVYLDLKGQAFTKLGIEGMPSSFLLDADGVQIETIIGAREWDHPGNIKAVRQLISPTAAN